MITPSPEQEPGAAPEVAPERTGPARLLQRLGRRGTGVAAGIVLLTAVAAVAVPLMSGGDGPIAEPRATSTPRASSTVAPDDATADPTTPPATPTTTPAPAPVEPVESAPPAAEPAAGTAHVTMPLRPATIRADGTTSVVSAVPASGTDLQDGDYVGFLLDVSDGASRTVSVDIGVLYAGSAVRTKMLADGAPEDGFFPGILIENSVERARTLPVSADVVVASWCSATDGSGVDLRMRSFGEWAAASDGAVSCEQRGALNRQESNLYWFDVRAGVVRQIIGQYTP